MGKLILIPTPIGNLRDITLRALDVLKEADVIFAEDTRVSVKLLSHYGIQKPLKAFHQQNEHRILTSAIETISNHSITCLVSDAGMPGISDPGFLLVRECIERGIEVECLPGASAILPAIVLSGLPSDRFVFEGFLPHKKGRQKKLTALAQEERTIVFYESPHRIVKTLGQIAEFIGGDRRAAAVREISKMHEETVRGSVLELLEHFTQTPPRGEFVLVIEGCTQP